MTSKNSHDCKNRQWTIHTLIPTPIKTNETKLSKLSNLRSLQIPFLSFPQSFCWSTASTLWRHPRFSPFFVAPQNSECQVGVGSSWYPILSLASERATGNCGIRCPFSSVFLCGCFFLFICLVGGVVVVVVVVVVCCLLFVVCCLLLLLLLLLLSFQIRQMNFA